MILGLDIGGTSCKMAFSDGHKLLSDIAEKPTNVNNYQFPVIDMVVQGVKTYLRENPVDFAGIGVSATGQIDTQTGVVIGTGKNVGKYEGTPIKQILEKEFNKPVTVLNDANAAALGETVAGSAVNKKAVLMLTLGTGVGCGIVIDGKVYGGARGIAGEAGHMTLYKGGLPCGCGRCGCFELYASTTALVRQAKEKTQYTELNGRIIFEKAKQGDLNMLSLLDTWIDDIAYGASSLVHILNPDVIVIGGGVSAQQELLIEPLIKKIKAYAMPCFSENLYVTPAKLGNSAGLIGAVAYWIERKA
ncbi:MAG: ROK family protein [Eubacteriales bacterium]|nr:ROK family protein [Eubacteriales bacterium]